MFYRSPQTERNSTKFHISIFLDKHELGILQNKKVCFTCTLSVVLSVCLSVNVGVERIHKLYWYKSGQRFVTLAIIFIKQIHYKTLNEILIQGIF